MTATPTNSAGASASKGVCPFGGGATSEELTNTASRAAAAFDPFGSAYQDNPGKALEWARENAPVFFDPKLGYWVVTRYEDVQSIFRDNITFSPANALEKITPLTVEAQAILARHQFGLNRTLVNEDEPQHTARRRALIGAFDVDKLAHHEHMVRELVTKYIDKFAADGHADLVDQLLYEVPLQVAFEFLGVPEHDKDLLRKYSVAHTISTWGKPTPEQQAEVAENIGNFWELAGEILAELRKNPESPGWMPMSIRVQQDQPEVVTDSYLHSMMMAGIVAAHETTAHSAANAIKLLLSDRKAWQAICDDPSLIPGTVEECLRLSGGVAAWRRITTRPATVGGVNLPAGAKILVVMAAANRDPRHFPEPDTIDVYRDNMTDHLTFGFGSHQCMGKNLARLELQVFLQELSRRFPDLRLAEQEFSYVPNTSFRGPERLLVEWDPQGVASTETQNSQGVGHPFPPIVFNGPGRHLKTRTMTVSDITTSAHGVCSIRLQAADGQVLPTWRPGSHIEIEAGGFNRHYSLVGENSGSWEIAVALSSDSRGGSHWLHHELHIGDEVRVRGPRGTFTPSDEAESYIFLAGGIGITPMLAMADAAKKNGRDYRLIYCGRSRQHMAYLDRAIREHGTNLDVHITDEGTRFDVTSLPAAWPDGTQLLMCGPERLLAAVRNHLSAWPADTVVDESFTAINPVDPANNEPFEIELASTGERFIVPADETLLDFLAGIGKDVDADCREGLCGTCALPVASVTGELEHRDAVLSDRERAANHTMLCCVSRGSKGSRITLDL